MKQIQLDLKGKKYTTHAGTVGADVSKRWSLYAYNYSLHPLIDPMNPKSALRRYCYINTDV